ncbi:hypothetical protein ACFUOZ_16740 [Paenarthrobacter sp. NPDC057355]|uniref:hypothetical protein n=1 Tax=Paenarthrobacter sp. NPDC057355 TaxID=3346105 RepID=UPI00364366E5
MTAQITARPNGANAADTRSPEVARQPEDAPGQARTGVAVREPFNPLAAGLRSIWPQSVVGF